MAQVLIVLHVLVAVALIGLILIQHGKGADVGAAFGSGASGTVFGSRGSASFLSRVTAGLAAAFFLISLSLAYLASHAERRASILDQPGVEQPVAPAPEGEPPATPAPGQAAAPAEVPADVPDVPGVPPEPSQPQ